MGGFAYVELAPGDTYLYYHNEVTIATEAVIVGGVVVIGVVLYEGSSRLFQSAFACHHVKKDVLPDYCTGSCTGGLNCSAATTRGYGWGGTQPSTCGCK